MKLSLTFHATDTNKTLSFNTPIFYNKGNRLEMKISWGDDSSKATTPKGDKGDAVSHTYSKAKNYSIQMEATSGTPDSLCFPNSCFKNCTQITEIIFPSTGLSIGTGAFSGCSDLAKITTEDEEGAYKAINNVLYEKVDTQHKLWLYAPATNENLDHFNVPDGVTHICAYAFSTSQYLKSISIPDSVIDIGEAAFYNCAKLGEESDVVLPKNLTLLQGSTFYGCTNLHRVRIPAATENINDAFVYCKNVLFSVDKDNPNYCSVNDSLYSKDMRVLKRYATGHRTTSQFTMDDRVYTISSYAFCSAPLSSITLNENLTKIDQGAFFDCQNLIDISIPKYVWSIGVQAFCGCTSLTTCTFVGETHLCDLGWGAFLNCKSLKSITIPWGVTIIGGETFESCKALTSVTIPDSVNYIGQHAFGGCFSLTSLTIPDTVDYIGPGAFFACYSLAELSIPFVGATREGMDPYNTNIKADALQPDTLHYLCKNWDSNGGKVRDTQLETNIKIKVTSATQIGTNAFKGWTHTNKESGITGGLISIELNEGITSIGSEAFYGCSVLQDIVIPDSVTEIGSDVFTNCTNWRNVIIGNGIKDISIFTFSGCSSLKSIKIGNGVTSIGKEAFKYCDSLTSVVIGDSVTSIGDYAFSSCISLTNIGIPASVTSIGEYAFEDCTSLKSIEIPNKIEEILTYTFSGCNSLKSVVIGDKVKSIGKFAFYGCEALTSMVLPVSVNSIEDSALRECNSLRWIYYSGNYIQAGSLQIKNEVLQGCTWYLGTKFSCIIATFNIDATTGKQVKFKFQAHTIDWGDGSSVEECDSSTLAKYTHTYSAYGKYHCYIYFDKKAAGCSNFTFSGCSSLTSIEIPDSVTSIGDYAFNNCSGLTSVVIPESVTSIGEYAFSGCSSLEYTIKGGLKYLGNINNPYVLLMGTETTDITTATIENTCKFIGDSAFRGCGKLVGVAIPKNVTSIGNSAFSGCSSLTIYCEVTTAPSGWSSSWNSSCPVVWNVTRGNNIYVGMYISGTSIVAADPDIKGTNYYRISIDKDRQTNKTYYTKNADGSYTEYNGTYEKYKYYEYVPSGKVIIPAEITEIKDWVFHNCNGITKVVFPQRNTNSLILNPSCFEGCKRLRDIQFEGDWSATDLTIGRRAFYKCATLGGSKELDKNKPITITIPKVYDIHLGFENFALCPSLNAVNFLGYINYGGGSGQLFRLCGNLSHLQWFNAGTNERSITTFLFENVDKNQHRVVPPSLSVLDITLAQKDVPEYSFKDWYYLKQISFNSEKSIGKGALEDCRSLRSLYGFSFGDKTDTLAYYFGADNISSVNEYTIPRTLETIYVTKLNDRTLPTNAFRGSPCLRYVQIYDPSAESDGYLGGINAFMDCPKLDTVWHSHRANEQVKLPQFVNGVSCIPSGMFNGCTALKKITAWDSGLRRIDGSAFYNCSNLTSIPTAIDQVWQVGSSAFSGCTALTGIDLSQWTALTDICNNAFQDCNLSTISLSSNVRVIGDSTFRNKRDATLGSLSFGEGSTELTIGARAFSNHCCATIKVPDRVTSIGEGAFWTQSSKLSQINLPFVGESATASQGYNQMFGWIFGIDDNHRVLKDNQVLTTTDTDFEHYFSVWQYNGIDDRGRITKQNVDFYYFIPTSSLLTVIIKPNKINNIAAGAFRNTHSLQAIQLPFTGANPTAEKKYDQVLGYIFGYTATSSNTAVNANYAKLVYDNEKGGYVSSEATLNLTYQYGDGEKYYHYYIPTTLKTVTIQPHKNYKSIPYQAFYRCVNLAGINIYGIEVIDQYAFRGCIKLQHLILGESIKSIKERAFYEAFTESTDPTNTKVTYNGTIDDWAQISFADSSANPLSYAKNLYIDNELVTEAKITIATNISAYAFYNCSSLTSIEIPNSVTSIGDGAFYNCDGLKTVTIKTGLTYIGDEAFAKCQKLTNIYIPETLTSIGEKVFEGCPNVPLHYIKPKNSELKYLGDTNGSCILLMSANTSITTATDIVSTCRVIYHGALQGCSKLEQLSIPNSVVYIGKKVCGNSLKNLSLYFIGSSKDKPGKLSDHFGCEALTDLTITAYLEDTIEIADYACQDCTQLNGLTLNDNITSIGSHAFQGAQLCALNIPNKCTTIGAYAFESAIAGLNELTLGEYTTKIGDYAFANNACVQKLTNADKIKDFGKYAFANCNLKEDLLNLSSAEYIRYGAFANNSNLQKIKLNDTKIKHIGFNFIYNDSNTNITYVTEDTTDLLNEYYTNGERKLSEDGDKYCESLKYKFDTTGKISYNDPYNEI